MPSYLQFKKHFFYLQYSMWKPHHFHWNDDERLKEKENPGLKGTFRALQMNTLAKKFHAGFLKFFVFRWLCSVKSSWDLKKYVSLGYVIRVPRITGALNW